MGRMRVWPLTTALVVLTAVWAAPPPAGARPSGPTIFCQEYPESPLCAGTSVTCALCHTSTAPGGTMWNSYGIAVFGALGGTPFDEGLAAALAAAGTLDSDQDGRTSAEEITYGSLPGDPVSVEKVPWSPYGEPNPRYAIGTYDVNFAYKRASIAFCGRSPTYAEMQALAASTNVRATLHDKVQACLESSYWRDRMLPRLADPKIRPIDRFEMWVWDYQLFRFALTGDRDARDLLLADYHVVTNAVGELQKLEGVIPAFGNTICVADSECEVWERCAAPPNSADKYCAPFDGAQPLDPSLRAGMLTTNWFHFYNTMFSALPRQTASQAYRAYADLDIARQQGLYPTETYDALDVDDKGILQEECWQCHSTLERLSYPFAAHNGIGGGAAADYNELRPVALGLWDAPENAPVGVIFGVEVTTIREWAQVLAASEQFARMIVKMLWRHAVGRAPGLEDNAEFTALWKGLPEQDFNAESLIHSLVDTMAFGAP